MKLIAVMAALLAILAPLGAAAQKTPEKIRLAATSKEGAVLIRVPVKPFDYALQFSKDGSSGFMSRVYVMKVKPGQGPGHRYIARTLAPGRYRLDSIWQQGRWSACLESGTFEFNVAPGRIAFLGTLDTDQVLASIQAQAAATGATVLRGTDYRLSHGFAERPVIGGRDAAGLAEAREFAQKSMNGSGSLTELAAVTDTSFSTSRMGKSIKICG